MGIFTREAYESSILVTRFVCALLIGAVLREMLRLTAPVKARLREEDEDSNTGTWSYFRGQCTGWRLTLGLTKASVVVFFTICLTEVVFRVLFFALCHDCAVRNGLWDFNKIAAILAYALMFAAHFERLRMTFINSPLELPQWASKVMYGAYLCTALLFFATLRLMHSQPKAAAGCLLLAVVLYFAGLSSLIRVFFKKTIAAANTTPPDIRLLEVAVRITVVVTVSLVSTTMTMLLFAVVFATCHQCYFWLTVVGVLLNADQCLNSFCLMCTFSGAVAPYKRVFGKAHMALLKHVSKTLTPEAELSQLASVTRG